MILSDITIKQYINAGKIKILPEFDQSNIRPTGIRLHLGNEILEPVENQTIDLTAPQDVRYNKKSLSQDGYLIKPGMFLLAATYESIMTAPNIICHLEGRSTIARLGLSIHCTAGIIDNVHDEPRAIVLELKNNGLFKLKIKPHLPIGMLVFSELSQPIRQPSQSQYKNQNSVEPPNLHFVSDQK